LQHPGGDGNGVGSFQRAEAARIPSGRAPAGRGAWRRHDCADPPAASRQLAHPAGSCGMTHILVVEDEPSLRIDLVDYLNMRGFSATGVGTAAALNAELGKPELPDIIVLDIGLPDGNGFDLAARIRENHACGIIMLTAHGEPDDRVRGFESGADIYLVKHSSLREIEASIQSLMRRLQNPQAPAGAAGDQWVLNRASWLLTAPNRRDIRLTATEFAFVNALLEQLG